MKPVSQELIDFLTTSRRMLVAELYSFGLIDGNIYRYTDLDIDLGHGGFLFEAKKVLIEGLRYKTSVGLEVDEQELKISAYPGDQFAGADFFQAVGAGLLDGAYMTRQRVFWRIQTGLAAFDYLLDPVGTVTLFVGRISKINKLGRTHAEMLVKSPLVLLDMDMPRNTYQASCLWNLFDSGCTLNRNTFAVNGVVDASGPFNIAVQGGVSPVSGGDGQPYFAQGRLLFTSGAQNGLETTIQTNDSISIYYRFPPITGVQAGDTFTMWPGCGKTGRGGACELKFNNLANFRGFPRVPPITQSY